MSIKLLALLLALQKINDVNSFKYSLQQLGNKLLAYIEKATDYQSVQTKIDSVLQQNEALQKHYDSFLQYLQSQTSQDLKQLLPTKSLIEQFKPKKLQTLGYIPRGQLETEENLEIENTVVEIAAITLKHDNPTECSKQLVPFENHDDKNE